MRPVLDVLLALHDADVRAVVVGGVAVVLHGHPRLTADLDLVAQASGALARERRRRAEALASSGSPWSDSSPRSDS